MTAAIGVRMQPSGAASATLATGGRSRLRARRRAPGARALSLQASDLDTRVADGLPDVAPESVRLPPALADCAWIVLCGALVALLVRPFQDTPFVDDWVYAWSVQRLLDGHGLQILDWSSHPNFAHILWGALFCVPFGFSFVALRVSTWVAALLALCALHLLLRELGVARRDAFLGTAVLGLNPIFFMLAATFMTDVPFLAAFLWATFALVAAIERRSDRWLAVFVVLSSVAAAVRVVALVTPIAALLTLVLHGGAWGRSAGAPGRHRGPARPLRTHHAVGCRAGRCTSRISPTSSARRSSAVATCTNRSPAFPSWPCRPCSARPARSASGCCPSARR